ncbi:hypothetical protein JCM8547_002419 [Rhodosporidiobolus lusitaniae]
MSVHFKPARPSFLAKQHTLFSLRHAKFLPTIYQNEDANRMTLAYFCLASLSLLPSSAVSSLDPNLSALDVMLKPAQKSGFARWVYEQQLPTGGFRGSDALSGGGNSFTPSADLSVPIAPNATCSAAPSSSSPPTFSSLDRAHVIQSYTALLILAILDDDFSRLDQHGLLDFVGSCQNEDGSFSHFPGCQEDPDPRSTYSAFAIASMLNDWSLIDVDRAFDFLNRCRRFEGGFAQRPGLEANAGPTYCAIASFSLSSRLSSLSNPHSLLRWLIDRQVRPPARPPASSSSSDDADDEDERRLEEVPAESAGFQGRANKSTDACYSFWTIAGLSLLLPALSPSTLSSSSSATPLKLTDILDPSLDRAWLLACQHPLYGGIAREPGAPPDVYHTYLSLAALSLGAEHDPHSGLDLRPLDPGWNVRKEVAARIRERLWVK